MRGSDMPLETTATHVPWPATSVDGSGNPPVGLLLGSALGPAQVRSMAVEGERLGFRELWVSEDYFFHGGIADAAVALASTARIPVGIGILSGVVRHPAVLAMELATLAEMFPGRLRPGIGLGVPAWLDQMAFRPKSPVRTLRECITTVRQLLDGRELTQTGETWGFDRVRLTYPPQERVPLDLGVIGPRLLQLAGEIADGTVGSVLAGTDYVRWARQQIATGALKASRTDHHRFTVFALFAVGKDARKAKASLRGLVSFYLAACAESALTEVYGIREEIDEMARGGPSQVEREMPERWLEDLAVAGEPDECAEKINSLLAAGADSVVLFPAPGDGVHDLCRLAGDAVLPRVRLAQPIA